MKKCSKCGEMKEYSDFYKQSSMKDGYASRCKECKIKDVKSYRCKNIDKYREYDRKRNHLPHRYSAQKERTSEYSKANKIKTRAHAFVKYYINKNTIVKPNNCCVCGKISRVVGHRKNYDNRLDVVWVCQPCHSNIHSSIKNDV